MSGKKEYSLEDAENELNKFEEMVSRYSGEVPSAVIALLMLKLAKQKQRITDTKKHPGDPKFSVNPVAIVKAEAELRREFTLARYKVVWEKVHRLDLSLRNKPFGSKYSELKLAADAAKWLADRPKNNVDEKADRTPIADILKMIEVGNGLSLQLRTPWGRCNGEKCHEVLVPVDRDGSWRVYKTCRSCYGKSKAGKAPEKTLAPAV